MPEDLRTLVPRPNPTCNVRALPIGPEEAFVLSRVDGYTSAAEIGLMTGLGEGVGKVLEKLAAMGAVLGVAVPSVEAPKVEAPPAPSGVASPGSPPAENAAPKPKKRLPSAKYDAAELEQEADLEPEKKKRILDLFYVLDELDHYALLGVDESADKKAIKAAYYRLAPEFHPDKYFRKNLGAFKPKMEAIFKRLTEAEETLARSQTRAEYDAYLAQRRRTESIERILRGEFDEDVSPPSTASAPAPPPAAAEPAAPSPFPAAPPPRASSPAPTAARPATAPPPPGASGTARSPEEDRMRRQILATKLASGRFSRRAPTPSPPEGESSGGLSAQAAAETLRKMQAAKAVDPTKAQFDRYIAAANDAVARNDAVAAANAYHLAATMKPEDAELQEAKKSWAAKAASQLATGYQKQGEYEAREGKWPEAARSYLRALQGMPNDASLHAKAAAAIVKAEGDLHQAADLAKRAIALAPGVAGYHVTLAEVYLAAKLVLNAKRELEAAAKIAPQDDRVRALLKRLG